MTQTDQLTKAIVANSGSNSVSIVDLVNATLITTIPVGQTPTGISLSPDKSKAYIANYGDGTVSELDLNALTIIGTATVGGHPSTVTTANDGSIWVGGNGYIAKLAGSLSLIGTYSTGNRTVISLQISNGAGELASTMTDANGNVFLDEVDISRTVQSHAYSSNASHQISTLNAYYDSQERYIRAYARAVVNSSVVTQTATPTIIVNDGWAAISATPTGFAVIDLTDHTVIMSATTPAPVTAIAVDPQLHVAYVAIPDANELLTVPMPN